VDEALGSVVSNRIGIKFGGTVLRVNTHRLTEKKNGIAAEKTLPACVAKFDRCKKVFSLNF